MNILTGFGFSQQDTMLLIWCPACSALGGFIRFIMKTRNFESLYVGPEAKFASRMQLFAAFDWLLGHLILSASAGLLLALYFVGALIESPTTTARLLAFSILLGFAAPRLWLSQERIVTATIEKKLKSMIEDSLAEKMALPK